MHRSFGHAVVISVFALIAALAPSARAGVVDLPRFPSISPDGSQIVFSWRGDLWKVSSDGGQGVRLTSHTATETHSAWSPDGSHIAFNSERLGANNIFIMRADGSGVRAVTDTDRPLTLSAFSHDGEHLLMHASMEGDVYRGSRPYRVSASGGPITRLHDAFGHSPSMSPDGSNLAFVRGESSSLRRHYRGPARRNIWVQNTSTGDFSQITEWEGNDDAPRFAGNALMLFLSDRENETVNLYAKQLGRTNPTARALTRFEGVDVHGFDVSRDGRMAVVAVWDALYTVDLTNDRAQPRKLNLTAPTDAGDDIALKNVSRDVTEAALSPDGKVMAYVAYGRIFVRSVDDNAPTRQVTRGHDRCADIAWAPCGTILYFSSDRDGTESIYRATVDATRSELIERVRSARNGQQEQAEESAPPDEDAPDETAPEENPEANDEDAENGENNAESDAPKRSRDDKGPHPAERWRDAVRFTIDPVVQQRTNDRRPVPAPDGKQLSFQRERGDIVILDLESGEERTFIESWSLWNEWRWSPDARWIAYTISDSNYNWEIYIAPSDGSGDHVNITMHPGRDASPRWSADGRILAFVSDRIEDSDVWLVFLDRTLERKTAAEMDAYFEEAKKQARRLSPLDPRKDDLGFDPGDAVELSLRDAYLRLRRVTSFPGSEGNLELMPAGDALLFSAAGGAGGDGGLFTIKWNGSDHSRIGPMGSVQHLSLDGSKATVIRGGRAQIMALPGGRSENVDLDATIRIDLADQASQMFHEAARRLGMTFYHPTMKDLDWDELTMRYHTLAIRSRTPDEFSWVANRFLGELNASHMGVNPPREGGAPVQAAGRLGIDKSPVDRGFRVDRVLEFGPADRGELALEAGDIITGVEFEPLAENETLTSRLRGTIGREITVTVLREGEEIDLLITPHSYGAEVNLRYDDWQRHNARLVDEWSGGRIGYLHIRSMGIPALYEFERDLYASAHAKDGLLIDVRNNGGGWTTDRILASIMAPVHAYTRARGDNDAGLDSYPQDRLFIQRYTRPVNMLCNENSFSNAEIISHAFKTLGRGTLVGEQTYGGVISTGGFRLIDGTTVREPFRGWYLLDGTDMENNGAIPDIIVPQTPEDESAERPYGLDRQLRIAVEDLLSRLDD
ncbi:MAG: PDZ domain-containing protein [Phycisphaeraceae bacterium]|nr:MAG: PDZ domain-containing protein [Phycisphaeraceae bacterium]